MVLSDIGSVVDIGSFVAIASLVVGVIKIYLEQRKNKKELELSRQYLQTLTKILESQQDLERQKLRSQRDLEKERLEWQKLKDISKALWELSQSQDTEYDF